MRIFRAQPIFCHAGFGGRGAECGEVFGNTTNRFVLTQRMPCRVPADIRTSGLKQTNLCRAAEMASCRAPAEIASRAVRNPLCYIKGSLRCAGHTGNGNFSFVVLS